MEPDGRLLGTAFVLLAALLGLLLLFAWAHNRKAQALAWWGAAYFLFASGIGLGQPGQAGPGYLTLLLSNALVALGYGVLYAGCRTFNGRGAPFPAIILGAVVWTIAFLAINEMPRIRLLLLSLIAGGYAVLSAWELGKHASQRLVSQRTAVVLLLGLAAFNVLRGLLGLWPSPMPWIEAFTIRWSGEIALVLVVYAPALAFMFLSMAKESIEADHRQAERALRESEEHYRHSVELNPGIPWTADPQGNIIAVSSRLHEVTGLPVAEGLGRGWIKALHPDDLAPTLQCWLRSVSTGEPLDIEYRVRLTDQNYHWFRARAAARFKQDGTVERWYGTLEDIHDRKDAEERLR